MTLLLLRPAEVYTPLDEERRNQELEQADRENWKLTGDVDHPHAVTVRGRSVTPFQTFAANDATPSVALGRNFKTANAAPTTVTDFDDGTDGQEIFVKINDANTTIDFTGSGLEGNAGVNWTPASGDAMRCVYDGSQWTCAIIDTTA